MISRKWVGLLAGGVVLTQAGGSRADTTVEAQNEELRARVAHLESRLATVESQNNQDWLTEQRANEIKSLVQEVLADADTRSSLMAQGMTAGYDNGAVIGSADGNWLLRTNVLLQERFVLRAQNTTAAAVDDSVWGFETTRAKFYLSGHVVSPEWFYKLAIETSPNNNASVSTAANSTVDNRLGLNEAYIGYDYGNGVKVKVGNMKAPLLFEELVEDYYQQAVERSLVSYVFSGGYTTGISVEYQNDQFSLIGMFNNGVSDLLYGGGVGAGGTNNSVALVTDTAIAVTLRGQWLAMGTWDQFKDYTSAKGEEMGIVVGGAIHWQQSEDDIVAVPDIELFTLTGDVSVELGGANVYASMMYANAETTTGGTIAASPWGFVFGGGWTFHETWELFGRAEYCDPDNLGLDTFTIVTGGINKYFAGHNAKWSTDIGFGLDTVPFAVPVTGWSIDSANEESQFVLRSQLQIFF